MCKTVRRGYCASDEKEFSNKSKDKLYKAGKDLNYLLSNGYNLKGASVFVGNHYLLSERQRLSLARGISASEDVKLRKDKEIKENFKGRTVHIDGFNTIITLETAFSNSLLLKSMDGTIRDLAGLRGTYKVIDKTLEALKVIKETFEDFKIGKAVFYLDAPVSNSGRLKEKIFEILGEADFEVEVQVIYNVDSTLEKLDNVISTDAIILNKCEGWINLNRYIMDERFKEYDFLDFEENIF